MSVIKIKEPIWKSMSVGVDPEKFNDILYVQIMYKNVHNVRMYPFTLKIDGRKARMYPTQILKNGKMLHIIPIKDFDPCHLALKQKKEVKNEMRRKSDVPGTSIVFS